MKLLNSEIDRIVIEFTKSEFISLNIIAHSMTIEYAKADKAILDLSEDEVYDFDEKVNDIVGDYSKIFE